MNRRKRWPIGRQKTLFMLMKKQQQKEKETGQEAGDNGSSRLALLGPKELEAFPVDDGWARLIVLGLGNPHLQLKKQAKL